MTFSKQPLAVKHIPQRSCIACRTVRPKRELIRLVYVAGGNVEIDSTGKKTGRGAYLCKSKECWENGLNTGRLEHALKAHIHKNDCNQLLKYAEETWFGDSREGAE